MADPVTAVVVGSLHYDIFVDAPHRPAKGETVTGRSWAPKFGGKGGNQARAIAAAGAPVRLVSAVGPDDFAAFLIDELSASGVGTNHVARDQGSATGMSVAIADDAGDYGAVIVSGANLTIDPAIFDDPALWRDAVCLILQNEVTEAANIAAARAARRHGAPVLLNAAPWRPMSDDLLDRVDILVVNALEAEAMCGVSVSDLASAQAAAESLGERFACVIVTAGGEGVACRCGASAFERPAKTVTVVSTHGAGDTFIGALVATLLGRGAPHPTDAAALEPAVDAAIAAATAHVAGGRVAK